MKHVSDIKSFRPISISGARLGSPVSHTQVYNTGENRREVLIDLGL